MRIYKIVKNLKNFGRTRIENEKWIEENKATLFEFVKNHPIHPVREAAFARQVISGLFLKPVTAIAGILIVVLLAGGGTAYAAQGSLPGDTLYPVKLLTENAQTTLALRPEKKVELEVNFANRRLEELQKLQAKIKQRKGEMSPEIVQKAMKQAEARLKKAEERIAQMESGESKEKALETAFRLEEALENHEQLLSEIAGDVPVPAQNALLHAQEVSAKHAENALQMIMRLEKTKESSEKVKENKGAAIKGAKERAEGKLKAIENRLGALKNYLENLKEKNKEINKEYAAKLDEAKQKIEEAKRLSDEGKYLESFETAHEAMRLIMEVKLFAKPVLTQPMPVESVPTSVPSLLNKPMILPAPEPEETNVPEELERVLPTSVELIPANVPSNILP